MTAADSAAVLVATAADFEARGEFDVARVLYEEVVRRYPDTPGALLTRDRAGAANGAFSASPAGSGPLAGALLNGSGGKLAVGMPLPFPTTLHDLERTGRGHTAWNVPLLRLRF
ncbi:tetratricopeptide repeat protein [Candidatus Palauibacter sp.]|uniref:tetratricopeptide repeat protein n=1 Tax=Candidatus Palauibacter sp. TaxID=3101350 RepID=UPI003B0280D6